MATIASLVVKIGADTSELRKELNAARRQIRTAFGSKGMEFSKTSLASIGGLAAGLGAASIKAVQLAGNLQMTKTALTSMLHSGEKANAFLKDLQTFAAATPFGFDQVSGAAQKFLAFGFSAKQVIPVLTAVGNSAAALGMGKDGIDRLTLAMGQMAAKGRVQGEEMRQLAEAGIPAWQMLADAIGTSIPEAMDKASRGQIDAATGLDALVKGMDKNFSGMMENQSKNILGLFAQIGDNITIAAQGVGNQLIEGLDITGKMQTINQTLQEFSNAVTKSGINQALKDMVPPSLGVAIAGLATTITIAAVPALYSMAAAAIPVVVGFAPVIAAGTALGAALYAIWKSGITVSDVLQTLGIDANVLDGVMKEAGIALDNFVEIALDMVDLLKPSLVLLGGAVVVFGKLTLWSIGMSIKAFAALTTMSLKVVNFVGEKIRWLAEAGSSAMGWLAETFEDFSNYLPGWAQGALGSIFTFVKNAVAVIDKVIDKIRELKGEMKSMDEGGGGPEKKEESAFSKLLTRLQKGLNFDNFKSDAGLGAGGAAGSMGSALTQLENQAAQTSSRIAQTWAEMFSTRSELVDRWYQEELAELEASRAENENYERDKTRLAEIYAQKRIDALNDEMEKRQEILRTVRDMQLDLSENADHRNDTGAAKVWADMAEEHDRALARMEDRWAEYENKYAALTAQEQAAFREAMDQRGIQYEMDANNRISLAKTAAAEAAAIDEEYYRNRLEALRQCKDIEADIEAATQQGRFDLLKQALSDENVARLNDYENRKAMMDDYLEACRGSMWDSVELMADVTRNGLGAMETSISGLLEGTESLGQAFQNLGKAVTKTISDTIAHWIASMIKKKIFGDLLEKGAASKSMALAAGQIPVYRELAMYKSMATGGVSATAGIAAFQIGAGMAKMPALANGGVAYGPTVAMIGEGRYREAVMPLSEKTYAGLAKGITEQGGGGNTIVVNAPLDGRRALMDFFREKGDEISESLGLSQGLEVSYGGALG